MRVYLPIAIGLVVYLSVSSLHAAQVITGVLRDEPGSSGNVLGSKVISAIDDAQDAFVSRIIVVNVPVATDQIARVSAYSATGQPIQQFQKAELLPQAAYNSTNIRLHLNARSGFEFYLAVSLKEKQGKFKPKFEMSSEPANEAPGGDDFEVD